MSDRVGSSKEFVRRIARYLNEQSAVWSFLGECEVSDLRKSCMEFVRRIARHLIEYSAVWSFLEELRGI